MRVQACVLSFSVYMLYACLYVYMFPAFLLYCVVPNATIKTIVDGIL